MSTTSSFDDIVAGFYRAAHGDLTWVDALGPFAEAVAAVAIHLHALDLAQGRVTFSHVVTELPVEAEFDYIRQYHHIDPRAGLVLSLPPGEWMNCWEHFDDAFVAADPFYQDFLIPYGSRYVSGVKLLQTESQTVVLGVHRGLGSAPLDNEAQTLCRRLARHLAEALRLYFQRVSRDHQGILGLAVLDRLRAPVVLVDDQRRLWSANAPARALLSRQTHVFDLGGRLHGNHGDDDAQLLVELLKLLREDPEAGPTEPTRRFLRLRGIGGVPPLGLYLYALLPRRTMFVFGEQPLAMLLFHQPSAPLELDPFVVAAVYDLTPAEARVAVAVGRGEAPEGIARALGVSVHTVRSHLATIFQKTGSSRQAELVSLLATLAASSLALTDT